MSDIEKDAGSTSSKGMHGASALTTTATPGAKYDGQVDEGIDADHDLHRGLKARQISMIALGGAIGTGLVIGSGSGLVRGGPVGLLLAYVIMAVACFAVMLSLGEMGTFLPTKKGFSGYATRFVDPAMGFALGWIYLIKYLIVTPNNIVAASIVVQYWTKDVPVAGWLTLWLGIIVLLNIVGVRVFGEIEFWMSLIKVITLTGLILLGIIIDLGGGSEGRIGFRYWRDQPFSHYIYKGEVGVFTGVWSCFVVALFAFMGSELVGVTFGEAKNPRKTVPAAIRRTFFRLLFFYIGSIFVVGLLVKATDPQLIASTKAATSAAASPFVLAIQRANIKVLPDIINGCILLFVLSAANSDLYIATRTLYALAAEGQAPRVFMRTNRYGTPYVATAICSAICCIAYLAVSSGSKVVFAYFVAMVTMAGALTWLSILFSHIRFMKALKVQGISRDELPWKAPFQPYISYVAFVITFIVALFKGFDAFTVKFNHKTFITHYILIPVYILAFVGYKLVYKTKVIPLAEVDLVSGRREFEEDAAMWEEQEAGIKQPWYKKLWDGA